MAELPKTYQKLVVQKLTTSFEEAVSIVEADMCNPRNDEVCIRNRYVGLNADDINFTKEGYFTEKVPCDIGFEGIGEVVSIGSNVEHLKIGDKATYITFKHNAYAEYSCVPADHVFKVPEIKPEYLVLAVSGLTACIGLDQAGRMKKGETVLISAAAGGVGHIAVQWAKLAKCHVIGTCSTDEKGYILKQLGCDRVINYSKEHLATVLKEEYPNGVDVVWETIGGAVLETCLQNLATKGRVVIAGFVSRYKKEGTAAGSRIDLSHYTELIMYSSRTIQGFNTDNYKEFFSSYFYDLLRRFDSGEICALYNVACTEFTGLEGIIKGNEHLYSRKSIGKILAKIS